MSFVSVQSLEKGLDVLSVSPSSSASQIPGMSSSSSVEPVVVQPPVAPVVQSEGLMLEYYRAYALYLQVSQGVPLDVQSRVVSKRKRRRSRRSARSVVSQPVSQGSYAVPSHSSGVSGDCYLWALKEEVRSLAKRMLGSYPTFHQLLMLSSDWFRSEKELQSVSVMRVIAGQYHVAATGPTLWDTLVVVAAGIDSPERGVMASYCQQYEPRKELISKAPKLFHVLGGKDGVGFPPAEAGTQAQVAYLRAVAAGSVDVVVAHSWSGGGWQNAGVVRCEDGVVSCPPEVFYSDGYQSYLLELNTPHRNVVLLPPRVYLQDAGVRVGSDLYPTCLVVAADVGCHLVMHSGVSGETIKEVLGPGICWSTELRERFGSKECLRVAVVPLVGAVLEGWRASPWGLSLDSSGARFAAQKARIHVEFSPQASKMVAKPNGRMVELSEPLDDWKAVARYRVSGRTEKLKGRIVFQDDCWSDFLVLGNLRSRMVSGKDIVAKLAGVIEVFERDAVVSFNAYRIGNVVELIGEGKGEVSLNLSVVADDYCFDAGGPSDSEGFDEVF